MFRKKALNFFLILCFIFSSSFSVFALEPEVETSPATNIEKTSATLSGSIIDKGGKEILRAGFEYGQTIDFGNSIDSNITFIETDSFGETGSGDGQFNLPVDITADSSGNIYVIDANNYRIQKFDSNGNYLSQFGTYGSGDGEFSYLENAKIAVDLNGNVYVLLFDLNFYEYRIQKFDSNGNYISQFGSYGSGDGEFYDPRDIKIDQSGNIYVVDSLNHRIQKFDSNGNYISQFGSYGSGDGEFNFALGSNFDLEFDSFGNVYVADVGNHRIQKFDSNGNYISKIENIQDFFEIDSFDNIYLLEVNQVRVLSMNGDVLYSFPHNLVYPQSFKISRDVIYVVDLLGDRIVKYSLSPESVEISNLECGTTYYFRFYAENEDGISYGNPESFSTSDCQTPEVSTLSFSNITQNSVTIEGFVKINPEFVTSVGFQYGQDLSYGQEILIDYVENIVLDLSVSPTSLGVDSSGDIYVTDYSSGVIKKYNSSGEFMANIGFNGVGDGGFENPSNIYIDSFDNIYVADSYYNSGRIQKFDSNGNYISQFGSYGSGDGEFNYPADLSVDSLGNIYVLDRGNYRIQKFDSNGNYISQFGSYGSGDNLLISIFIDSLNNVYVLSGINVQKFDIDGNFIEDVVVGPWDIGHLNNVFSNSLGNIYVSGLNLRKIEVYDSSGLFLGNISGNQFDYDGAGPTDVYIDPMDNLFLLYDDSVTKINSNFSTTLSGLTCGTTYHFRAFAENTDGAGYGDDLTFTTTDCPSSGGGGSSGSNPNPVLGCTDSDATNFNPAAGIDNGSCLYTPGAINGCTDSSAGNYSSIATVDDGSCLYGVFGCTTPTALNYNSLAEYDDGSCQYDVIVPTDGGDPTEDLVYGCDDPSALNYNSAVTSNDGTCDYTVLPIFGCTDISASNFDSNANQDDGSCAYIDIPGTTTLTTTFNSIISGVSSYILELPEPLKQSFPVVGLVVPSILIGILQPGAFAGALLRLWNLIPVLMGYKRKKRPWGTVYDSVTKQPLDPVYVSLKTLDGQEVSTSITDIDGRYGFLTSSGIYKITANKKDYIFPSQKLIGKTSDVLYDNLYFGEDLNVEENDQVLFKNIPMDAINFNWNEFEKANNKKLMRFYSKRDLLLAKIANVLFVLGFASSVFLFFLSSSVLNIIVLSIYVLILILRFFGVKPKQAGYVFDKEGNPLSFGIIRLYSKLLNREVGHTVLGKTGKYYLLTPNGEYFIKVQKKTGEDTYEDIYTSEAFKVRGGYVGKKIKLG